MCIWWNVICYLHFMLEIFKHHIFVQMWYIRICDLWKGVLGMLQYHVKNYWVRQCTSFKLFFICTCILSDLKSMSSSTWNGGFKHFKNLKTRVCDFNRRGSNRLQGTHVKATLTFRKKVKPAPNVARRLCLIAPSFMDNMQEKAEATG